LNAASNFLGVDARSTSRNYRANFLEQEVWLNRLGMLGLSVGVFVLSYVV
jgi:hypothetical protein